MKEASLIVGRKGIGRWQRRRIAPASRDSIHHEIEGAGTNAPLDEISLVLRVDVRDPGGLESRCIERRKE